MVLRCFTWIHKFISLFDQNSCSGHIPDNIVMEILSRLPIESVLNCRRVCKQWLAVTSSPYFTSKYLDRTSPGLLVQFAISVPLAQKELFLFSSDESTRTKYKLRRMHSGRVALNEPYGELLVGCCDGLIVLQPRYRGYRYFIFNLVTREKVIIKPPVPSIFCGIFFHHTANEYRIISSSDQNVDNAGYIIFVYGSKSKLWRQVATCPYKSAYFPTSVIFNGFCHWMTYADITNEIHGDLTSAPCDSSILTISLKGDSFRAMPHPGRECSYRLQHKHMTLVDMEGRLTCCVIVKDFLYIWLLEDYDDWTWTRRYSVRLDWTRKEFPYRSSVSLDLTLQEFPYIFNYTPLPDPRTQIIFWKKLCYIENRELVIDWPKVGLFRCHLDTNIVTRMDDGMKKRNKNFFYCVFPFKASFRSFSSS